MNKSLEEPDIRIRESLDNDWKFYLGDLPEARLPAFEDHAWRRVSLPHDWSIEGEYNERNPAGARGGFLPAGLGWYRRDLVWNPNWQGKKVFLTFDGIYMNSEVWINGKHLGCRPNGYIGFQYDLTPHLRTGHNVIAVKVDCSKSPSARWYTGSGIYRHVWLDVTSAVYIPQWGIEVTSSNVHAVAADLTIRTKVRNDSHDQQSIHVSSRIQSERDQQENGSVETEMVIPPHATIVCEQTLQLEHPVLWSPENPALYVLSSKITGKASMLDDERTTFGVRYFQFDSESGFSLNGVPMKFQGVCHHHDAGPVGAAVPDTLLEKRLRLLKEMGCNAIRTAHHPLGPEFYDLCDRIGLMVMDEAFDGWEKTKAEFDYGLYFEKWWQKDLGDLVLRDRNHPCIIMWSIGNEVKKMNPEMTQRLVDFVHQIDPTRPVTCGVQQVGPNPDENRSLLDIAGYNDGGGACFVYAQDHDRHPNRVMVATEAPHSFHTRGFYRTQTWWRDKNKPRIEIPNLTEQEIFYDGALQYSSSYDNSGVRTSARHSHAFVKKFPYLTGEFRWTGFDYLGESFGWPARGWNFGVIDLANFPKDHYYFYQSQYTKRPMIHLLPHWTHPGMEDVVIPVWVYTNCESAELFLNGRSLGRKTMDESMYLSWDVPYEPGALKALGFIGNEQMVEIEVFTAGKPSEIKLTSDQQELRADGKQVCQVSFDIVDAEGRFVPQGENTIHLVYSGPVSFLGMENGDPLDLTPAKAAYRKAFYGKGMGLFQSTLAEGDIEVMAAGMIGETVFKEQTHVSVSVQRLALRGGLPSKLIEIRYTMDGSQPNSTSLKYVIPITIQQSCNVRAVIYLDGEQVMELHSEFRRGEREKVIDLIHGNKPVEFESRFPGPFATQLVGQWEDGAYQYEFAANGELFRALGSETKKRVGCWWYDYPADPFETPDYPGTGEILWDHGNKDSIALATQEGKALRIMSEPIKVLAKK